MQVFRLGMLNIFYQKVALCGDCRVPRVAEADFSETRQIAYLTPEISIFTPENKIRVMVGRSTTSARLWSPRTDFSKSPEITYLKCSTNSGRVGRFGWKSNFPEFLIIYH